MAEKKQRQYFKLDRAERTAIERALDKNESAKAMTYNLGRSAASITDESKRNRTVAKGSDKAGGSQTSPRTHARVFWHGRGRATAVGCAATIAPRGSSANTRQPTPRPSPTGFRPRRAGA